MNLFVPDNVLQFGTRGRSRKRKLGSIVRTNRFTLAGAFCFAIGLPILVRQVVDPTMLPNYLLGGTYGLSFATAALALLGAHIFLRQVGMLPLVDDKMLIVPIFLSSYTFTLSVAIFLFGQVGLYLIATSFVLGIVWYHLVALMRVRLYLPRLAYVGGLPEDVILLGGNVEWEPLLTPRLPHDVAGIVFDAKRPPAVAFEHMLSRAILRNIPVYEAAHLREMLTGRVRLDNHPVAIFGQLLPSQPYLRIKRIVDTAVAVPALIVAFPLMMVAALLIRLESPGPALFRQDRIGFRGRPFVCYKLRSMRSDVPGPAYTTERDPRITRVGRFIRKWRIDELPQIFNILKGDMSWIGPRPEALSLARSYQREIPYYACRHSVRPGVTGWAAIHQGNVALVDAATRKLEYDFYYVKYFSVWLDLLIVLMTVRTVFTGFGSR